MPTNAWTLSAASTGSSCSHTRSTAQPASSKVASVARSRSRLRASFSAHHRRLLVGWVACNGQECQKQPSTYTATREGPNTMSGLDLSCTSGLTPSRNRRPRRWSSRLSASSGAVLRVACRDILELTDGEDAVGRAARGIEPFTVRGYSRPSLTRVDRAWAGAADCHAS